MNLWKPQTIADLGKIVTGKTPPSAKPEQFGKEFPFVTPSDIQFGNKHTKTERFLSQDGLEAHKRIQLPQKTVCVVCIGATIGKVCFIDQLSISNQQINSIIVNADKHDPDFVFYLASLLRNTLESYAGGAATPIVNKGTFSKIKVRVPVREEQRKIAAVLSSYDDLIETNKRRIEILEKMAEELYREWFVRMRFPGYKKTRFVKGVPEGWFFQRFDEICKFVKGKTPCELIETPNEGFFPYVNAAYLKHQNTDYAKLESNSVLCHEKDVLMLMDGSNSGLVFRAKDGIVASTFARIEMEDLYRNFIYEFLKASEVLIVSNNTGSAVPHANKEYINRLMFVVPTSGSLILDFNQKYDPIFKLKENLFLQNQNLTRTRDLLLPRLISGKLSVEDLDIQFPPTMREEEAEPEFAHA